jgi:hypothetical protein
LISETFDLKEVYAGEIEPLIDAIMAICKRERIPMMASFVTAVDPENFYTTTVEVRPHGRLCEDFDQAVKICRFDPSDR